MKKKSFIEILSEVKTKDVPDVFDSFRKELAENVNDQQKLFKYGYEEEEEPDMEGTKKTIYHQVYYVANDFIDELKNPIMPENAKRLFDLMEPIIKVINDLLDIQDDIYKISDEEIYKWQNIMAQILLVAKNYFIFFKEEKNKSCIELSQSLLNFAFNVEMLPNLESKIFSVLPELGTFLHSNEPIISLESSTGSGKTRCVPFFLSIRSIRENCRRPFIIMTQPSANIIYPKVQDFQNILKGIKILTKVDDIINYGKNRRINQPCLCLLTPYNALKLIKRASKAKIDLFNRSRWVLDEVHDRTIYIDTMIGFLHQELDKVKPFPCQIVLMTATMDQSIQKSLGKRSNNIALSDYTPYSVKEEKENVKRMRDIPQTVSRYLFKILEDMRNGLIEPGHILIFIAGNSDCQAILKEIREKEEKLNSDKNRRKIHAIHIDFDESSKVESINNDIRKEVFNKKDLFIFPIQLAGYVTHVQKTVAQSKLPPDLNNVVKIIISTNIVESSITIPDLAAVIDSGLYNRATFDQQTEVSIITKESISKKMATQRRGRVGRTRRGVYVGIVNYDYQNIEPQIKTNDLAASLLSLRNIGIKLEEVEKLPDKPNEEQVLRNIEDLKAIGALNEDGNITEKGKEICLYSNDFSPFFAAVILNIRDNMAEKDREYHEILAALIILIMTSQQLVLNPNSLNLQRHYNQSSDIITILKTFGDLFENSFQEQKDKCIHFGFEPNAFSRLITSFSNFIHKVFKRKENDRGFLRRHFKEIRKLISIMDLNPFIDYVIESINVIKPRWVTERMFSFDGISGLNKNGSINVANSDPSRTIIINSRPGWKGLECDKHFYAFSLLVRGRTTFGSIIHSRRDNPTDKIYKCISFSFNENISIPLFDEMLKCLNYNKNKRCNTFLPMHRNPTTDDYNTTLTYQNQWMGSNYMSICVKNDDDEDTMKCLIRKVKKMMAFVGNSILVNVPEVESIVEIYSIGSTQYSTKIYTLENHPYAYRLNYKSFTVLLNTKIDEMSKINSDIKIALNYNFILKPYSDKWSPLIVISKEKIGIFHEIEWTELIKKAPQKFTNPFIDELNSIAPNIITAEDSQISYLYGFMGNFDEKRISNIIKTALTNNFEDDIIKKKIPYDRIFYDEDINYDIESKRINDEIAKYRNKISKIQRIERKYNDDINKYIYYKNEKYPKLIENYKRQMYEYNLAIQREQENQTEEPRKHRKMPPKPKEPEKPKEPKKPDFEGNKRTIDFCTASISNLNNELKPMNYYFQARQYDLINPLQIQRYIISQNVCGTKGCVLTLSKDDIKVNDTKTWKCDLINEYNITIAHHLFHSLSIDEFNMIVKNVSEKFGIFVTKIGPYNALDESFGLFGNIEVTVIGKELVIPFIKSVLDALEKGANLANTPKYQIPNTIISNIAISYPANSDYFIKLMRHNKIDVTLDGPFVKGSLIDKKNAFNLINQRKVELLFPFLSIKIPENVMIGKLKEKIQQANNIRPPSKQWTIIESELIFPREDYNECRKTINRMTKANDDVHGCLYVCEKTIFSKEYLPVYNDLKTPVLKPFCVPCLFESLHYATANFFDLKRGSYSKEFLENNIEMIPPISICADNHDEQNNEKWPVVPIAQLLLVLQSDPKLKEMSRAWIKGIVEQSIRTCPFVITCCPEHPQKKFLISNNQIECVCKSCQLYFCADCKSWHNKNELCEKLDKSIKRCPKCGVPVVKNGGCNHMQCKCGAHWCFKCGAGPFEEGSQVYAHMSSAHQNWID
ncbi:hypothetical protein M9Y10_032563 [Tritrichomonas musculus]|uniref:Helicase conserved C-terminal domain containing protein n=1 Tax=Tritrichomonas musculus TaxID=1915356 RepID=A0ABR2GYR6_9EUKA